MWSGAGGQEGRGQWGRGAGGGGPGEKGAGNRIPKVAGSGRKRENYATLRNISQSKKMQRGGS